MTQRVIGYDRRKLDAYQDVWMPEVQRGAAAVLVCVAVGVINSVSRERVGCGKSWAASSTDSLCICHYWKHGKAKLLFEVHL